MRPGIERIAIPVLTVLLLALFLLRGQQESGQKGIAVCMDVQILSSEQFDTCAAELEEKAAVPGTILFNGCAAPFDEEKSLLYLPAGRDAEGCAFCICRQAGTRKAVFMPPAGWSRLPRGTISIFWRIPALMIPAGRRRKAMPLTGSWSPAAASAGDRRS